MHTLFFYLYLLRQLILLLHRMKINLFYGYSDCNPKDTTLEEVFQLILNDASVKERTERHRYYLNQGLEKEAGYEKYESEITHTEPAGEGARLKPATTLSPMEAFSSNTVFVSSMMSANASTYVPLSFNAERTSKNNGSPLDPGSLVRSSTAIFLTVLGNSFKKYLVLNGLYK